MNFRKLPQGNGQEIYIDPDWIKEMIQDADLIKYLYSQGYDITTVSSVVGNDAFFLTPCCDKHINSCKEDYVGKKRKKIDECLKEERFRRPITMSFPEGTFPTELPSLPFVLKNEQENGGIDKFLIASATQIEILRRFYHEISEYHRKQTIIRAKKQYSFIKDLEFDEHGKSNSGLCISIVNFKEILHEDFILQKFIKTPTKYNTSLRVVTSSSGDILCSSLKYSNESSKTSTNIRSIFERYLNDPLSPYFLGAESIVSNTVAGGNSILLGRSNYSTVEREILQAHDIDPDNAIVPNSVESVAKRIAKVCRREIGAISGMDFIYDIDEKEWKFLEQHEYPMLITYAERYNFPYESDSTSFFPAHRIVEIDARLHALALSMEKKPDFDEPKRQLSKTN